MKHQTFVDEKHHRLLMVARDVTNKRPNMMPRFVLVDLGKETASVDLSEDDIKHLTKMWTRRALTIEPTRPIKPRLKAPKALELLATGEQTTPERLKKVFTDDFMMAHGIWAMHGENYEGYYACTITEQETPIIVVKATDIIEYKGNSQWAFVKAGKIEDESDVSTDTAGKKAEEYDSDGAVKG